MATLTIETKVRLLSTMPGDVRRYQQDDLDALEEEGLITIYRPVHQPTGIPYDQQYHRLEVTEAGEDLVKRCPEYWDAGA